MIKSKSLKRHICYYCGAKRYIDNLYPVGVKGVVHFVCKNNDLCVLKMSYNKKLFKKYKK